MAFRMFGRKYVFFEEFDHSIDAQQGAYQAQAEHRYPLVGEELGKKEIFRDDKQQENNDKIQKLLHKGS